MCWVSGWLGIDKKGMKGIAMSYGDSTNHTVNAPHPSPLSD